MAIVYESPCFRQRLQMVEFGDVLHHEVTRDVTPGEYVYLVHNGKNVLQLGMGDQNRVR